MPLEPKKTKFRKQQRRRNRGPASAGCELAFGTYGLQALENGFLKTNQIEAARKALTHYLKRGGKVWIRVLADRPYTSRAAETRMGGGKGMPVGFKASIKRGHIIFEITGISREEAQAGFRLISYKLPLKMRMVERT